MNNELIDKLSWEDVREIVAMKTLVTNTGKRFETEEENYSEVIHMLRIKHKTIGACIERYNEILPIAEEIVGTKNRKERVFELIVLRAMVANKLKDEGYRVTDIGKVMGYNHATVNHYFEKKNDFFALPIMYEQEVRWFKLFDEALKNENNGDD